MQGPSVIFQANRVAESDWERLAKLRIKALSESGRWFAGDLQREQSRSESDWRAVVNQAHWVIFTVGGQDVGIMAVEAAEPIRGTDCWLMGCWVEPELRGRGITKAIVAIMDDICYEQGWQSQGLGVWPDNEVAIRAYERAGFIKVGEPAPSRSKPGQLYQMMKRSRI